MAQAVIDPPSSLVPGAGPVKCFSTAEVHKIAGGIKELAACRIAVAEKDKLIQERLVAPSTAPGIAFWQEPAFVWGGMVVSASVASLVTLLVVQKNK